MICICSEQFTRTAHRLDGPGPFTRQLIEQMGQGSSLNKQIRAITVMAVLISLAPYLRWEISLH